MLERFPEALVLAFPKGEAKGTRECIRRALSMGRVVVVYGSNGTPVIAEPALGFPDQ